MKSTEKISRRTLLDAGMAPGPLAKTSVSREHNPMQVKRPPLRTKDSTALLIVDP